MAFHPRTPTGTYWTEHRARAAHICMGCLCTIDKGDTYWNKRYREKARPMAYCHECHDMEASH